MSPELLGALGNLVDRYGLPIVLLVGLGWLLLTRRLVLGSELNYVEARRLEEREGRLAAEAALRELGKTTADAMEALADSSDRVVDQLEGRPTRARR